MQFNKNLKTNIAPLAKTSNIALFSKASYKLNRFQCRFKKICSCHVYNKQVFEHNAIVFHNHLQQKIKIVKHFQKFIYWKHLKTSAYLTHKIEFKIQQKKIESIIFFIKNKSRIFNAKNRSSKRGRQAFEKRDIYKSQNNV